MPPKFVLPFAGRSSEVRPEAVLSKPQKSEAEVLQHRTESLFGDIQASAEQLFQAAYNSEPGYVLAMQPIREDELSGFMQTRALAEIEAQYPDVVEKLRLAHVVAATLYNKQPNAMPNIEEFRIETQYGELLAAARRRVVLDKVTERIAKNDSLTPQHLTAIEKLAAELAIKPAGSMTGARRQREHDTYCGDVLTQVVDAAAKCGVQSREFSRLGGVYNTIANGRDPNVTRRALSAGLDALHSIEKSDKAPSSRLRQEVAALRTAFEYNTVERDSTDYKLYKRFVEVVRRKCEVARAKSFQTDAAEDQYGSVGNLADMLAALSEDLGFPIKSITDVPAIPEQGRRSRGGRPQSDAPMVRDNPDHSFGGVAVIRASAAAAVASGIAISPAAASHAAQTSNLVFVAPLTASPVAGAFIEAQATVEAPQVEIVVETQPKPRTDNVPSSDEVETSVTQSTPLATTTDTADSIHTFLSPEDNGSVIKTPQEDLRDNIRNVKAFVRSDAYNDFRETLGFEPLPVGFSSTDESTSIMGEDSHSAATQFFLAELARLDERYNSERGSLPKANRMDYILASLTAELAFNEDRFLAMHDPQDLYDHSVEARAVAETLDTQYGPSLEKAIGAGRYDVIIKLMAAAEVQLMSEKEKADLVAAVFPHYEEPPIVTDEATNAAYHEHVKHLTDKQVELKALIRMMKLGPQWKNRVYIMKTMLEDGYEPFQAAALIGNFCTEAAGCELDPTQHQFGGGPGVGWAQWGTKDRPDWDRYGYDFPADVAAEYGVEPLGINRVGTLVWYAHKHGLHPLTAKAQLGFTMWELNQGFGDDLRATKTLAGATALVMNGYERPAERIVGPRLAHARDTLDKFLEYKTQIRKEYGAHNNHNHVKQHGRRFTPAAEIMRRLHKEYGNKSGMLQPNELKRIGKDFGNHQLVPEAADSLRYLSIAFEEEFGYPLGVTDSYRDYRTQEATYSDPDKITSSGVHLGAVPGTSNHGWGLAVDMGEHGVNDYTSAQHKWLVKNAPKYGWHQPNWAKIHGDKPEPWHWEYMGGVILVNGHVATYHSAQHSGHPQQAEHHQQSEFVISTKGYTTPIPASVYADNVGTKYDGYAEMAGHHTGQDFTVAAGTRALAVRSGVVLQVVYNDYDGVGNGIKLLLDNGRVIDYAHLSRIDVKQGQKIRIGQSIGLTGNTGNSTGDHLHTTLYEPGQGRDRWASRFDENIFQETDNPMFFFPSVKRVEEWEAHHAAAA